MKSQEYKIVYAESMVEPYHIRTRYASRKCAQTAVDKLHRRTESKYAVYSLDEYAEAVKNKGEWKVSPFTGKKVWVALGTPMCCDPTTETYMSM